MAHHNKRLVGRRIRLVNCNDEYVDLPRGLRGTVEYVDDLGTVFVAWDNGSRLGLVEEAGDQWDVLPENSVSRN